MMHRGTVLLLGLVVSLALLGAGATKLPPGVNNVAQLFWRMAFGEAAMPQAGTGIECAACTVGATLFREPVFGLTLSSSAKFNLSLL